MLSLSRVFSLSSSSLYGLRNGINNGSIAVTWVGSNNYAMTAEEKLGITKPKKPLSAYLRFANQVRPTLVAKNPDLNGIDILKLASKNWHQVDDSVKQKFQREYEAELVEYKKKSEQYKSGLSSEEQEKIKSMKASMAQAKEKRKNRAECKELGKPKRPMSSYLLFLRSEKDSMKNTNIVDYQAKLSAKWYALTAKERAAWDQKALALKEAYQIELAQWETKMIKMGNIDFVRNKALATEKKSSKTSSQ